MEGSSFGTREDKAVAAIFLRVNELLEDEEEAKAILDKCRMQFGDEIVHKVGPRLIEHIELVSGDREVFVVKHSLRNSFHNHLNDTCQLKCEAPKSRSKAFLGEAKDFFRGVLLDLFVSASAPIKEVLKSRLICVKCIWTDAPPNVYKFAWTSSMLKIFFSSCGDNDADRGVRVLFESSFEVQVLGPKQKRTWKRLPRPEQSDLKKRTSEESPGSASPSTKGPSQQDKFQMPEEEVEFFLRRVFFFFFFG